MNFEGEKNIYSQNLQKFEFLDKNPERFPRFRLVLWSKMPDYCANPQKVVSSGFIGLRTGTVSTNLLTPLTITKVSELPVFLWLICGFENADL